MTDSRFKFLATAVSLVVVAIAAMIIFAPGKAKSRQSQPKGLGEYVYIDARGIVHADRKCSRLNYKGLQSWRVPLMKLPEQDYESLCPKCISDEDYKVIAAQ